MKSQCRHNRFFLPRLQLFSVTLALWQPFPPLSSSLYLQGIEHIRLDPDGRFWIWKASSACTRTILHLSTERCSRAMAFHPKMPVCVPKPQHRLSYKRKFQNCYKVPSVVAHLHKGLWSIISGYVTAFWTHPIIHNASVGSQENWNSGLDTTN